jgi:hypothetical protein
VNKLEQYGAEYALLLRRQAGHVREWDNCEARLRELYVLIVADDVDGTLYGAKAETARMSVPASVQLRQTEVPLPMRSDRLDGGDTFALSPIGDELTSGSLFAIVPCPPGCVQNNPHIHTADGAVHPTRLVQS